jgi:hypothetical protein
MSNDLVPSPGGAVVPSTGTAVGEHVGDMSVDRGAAPGAVAHSAVNDLQRALGFGIGLEQVQKAREVLKQHRELQDTRDKNAAIATLRSKWGAANYEPRIGRISEWLNTLPEDLKEAILCARWNETGDSICNDARVLQAMYTEASESIVHSDDLRDKAAAERELQAEFKGAWHSHLVTLRNFLGTMPQSAQEGITDARDAQGVAILNRPTVLKWLLQLAMRGAGAPRGGPAPDPSALNAARVRELERWMGAPRGSADWKRYWEDLSAQDEYRTLKGQGATGDGTAKVADSEVDKRIAEIDRWMGSRKGSADYKRYWDDFAVQGEYAELLDRRDRAQQNRRQ